MTFDGVGRGLAKTVSATGKFDFDNVAVQALKMRGARDEHRLQGWRSVRFVNLYGCSRYKLSGPTRGAIIVHADPAFGLIAHAGTAERIRDNDVVGIATTSDKLLGTCAYVRKSDPNKTPVMLGHRAQSYDVTMYDRRLGTKVGRRTFQPKDVSCNSSLEGTANATWNFPDIPDVTAWAKTFVR